MREHKIAQRPGLRPGSLTCMRCRHCRATGVYPKTVRRERLADHSNIRKKTPEIQAPAAGLGIRWPATVFLQTRNSYLARLSRKVYKG